MSQAKRKRKAKFRVGQIVVVSWSKRPFKVGYIHFDGIEGQIVYENHYGEERFENELRPLTARERGGR